MSESLAILGQQAAAAHAAGDFKTAAEKFQQIVAAEPQNEWARLNLLAILMSEGRYSEALENGRALLQSTPVPEDALVNMGALLTTAPLAEVTGYEPEITQVFTAFESMLQKDGSRESARRMLTALLARFFAQFRSRYRPVMISTVGGAGTYFTIHFFEYLERRLGPFTTDYHPVQASGFNTVLTYPRLGLFKVTTHGLCPGFEQSYDGPYRPAWDRLVAESQADRVVPEVRDLLDPRLTPEARLVHIHRDPMEWVITVFRQAVRNGRVAETAEALRDEVRGPILKRFVAQYFSFRTMAARFPEQFLILPFEDLAARPLPTFEKILAFIGVPKLSPDVLRSSLKSSSPEALMKVEDRTGRPTGPTGVLTHFDRDRTSRSRISLTDEDRAVITATFDQLGISMSEFGGQDAGARA